MSSQVLDGVTDIFVDMSALSIGVAFPIIKHFIELLLKNQEVRTNLHVIACHNPQIDDAVSSYPSDTVTPIHGFRGGWGLDEKSRAAMLWMPQLGRGKRPVLNRIFQMLRNVQEDTVVCPILPFPSSRPRLSDELIEEFAEELSRLGRLTFGIWCTPMRRAPSICTERSFGSTMRDDAFSRALGGRKSFFPHSGAKHCRLGR